MRASTSTTNLSPGELLSRNERLSLGATELLAAFGQGVTWPLAIFLGTALHLSGTELGWTLAVVGAGQILSGLAAGPLCDRFGKRAVLQASLALSALAWLLVAFFPSIAGMVVAQGLTGLGWACFTASNAYLGAHSPAQDRSRQFALLLAWRGMGFTLGPAIAGVALNRGVAVTCLTSVAASLAALAVARLGLRDSRVHADSTEPLASRGLRLPRSAWAPLLALMLLGASGTILGYYVPLHAQSGLNASAPFVAALFSCLGLTMVLAPGVLWLMRRHVDERTAATASFALVALACLGCALAAGIVGLTSAFFVWALAYDTANPLARSALSTRVEAKDQAQVMAAQQWGQGALNLALPPFSGWLYGMAGALPLFGLTAALSLAGVVVLWQCFQAPAGTLALEPAH